jgi:hypothetical protein
VKAKKPTQKSATAVETIDLSALSPEQKRALRDQLDQEDDQDEAAPKSYVYTNLTPSEMGVPDLGVGKGKSFVSFSFQPHQEIDLAKRFSPKDIRRSHYLRALVERGSIVQGKATKEQLQLLDDPIAARVRELSGQMLNGGTPTVSQIDDPAFGRRSFDLKLNDAMLNGPGGEREDISTRKR